jgi:hypothetical protein
MRIQQIDTLNLSILLRVCLALGRPFQNAKTLYKKAVRETVDDDIFTKHYLLQRAQETGLITVILAA